MIPLGMISGFFSANKIKLIVILLVVAALGIGFWVMKNKIENLKEQVTTLQEAVGGYKVTVAAFEVSISKQNESIKTLADAGKLMENKAKLKQQEAFELSRKHQKEINILLSENPNIETCNDVMSYLRNKAGGILKW